MPCPIVYTKQTKTWSAVFKEAAILHRCRVLLTYGALHGVLGPSLPPLVDSLQRAPILEPHLQGLQDPIAHEKLGGEEIEAIPSSIILKPAAPRNSGARPRPQHDFDALQFLHQPDLPPLQSPLLAAGGRAACGRMLAEVPRIREPLDLVGQGLLEAVPLAGAAFRDASTCPQRTLLGAAVHHVTLAMGASLVTLVGCPIGVVLFGRVQMASLAVPWRALGSGLRSIPHASSGL
jgi:hypothetical protein